jgi:hypothetical protein
MRPLLILTADYECVATLRGFFERRDFHKKLGCGPIQLGGIFFDSERDIRVHPGHDSGVSKDPQLVLLPERNRYDKALVILDQAWSGAPDADEIVANIETIAEHEARWQRERFEVILIQPELEAWIWQRNIHVCEAFEFSGSENELWDLLSLRSLELDSRSKKHVFVPVDTLAALAPAWSLQDPKPTNPKGVVEALTRHCGSGPASGVFNEIARTIGVRNCVDKSFHKMRDALCRWFPSQREPWE